MFTDKSVLPLRPRHHASMLLDNNDDDHAASSDSLRLPANDSQSRVNSRAASAKVRLFSSLVSVSLCRNGRSAKAYITVAIRLRYDYDTTIPRRIRLRRK